MKKYKAVIFDLDGTLLNTLEDLHESMNVALASCGMPEQSYDESRHFVGNGVRTFMELSVPDGSLNPRFEEAFSLFKLHYSKHCNDKTCLYPDIEEMLIMLKADGYMTAIVSNKYQVGVDILMKQYFRDYISIGIGEHEGIKRKPSPDGVYEVLRQLGITAGEAVYVGDSEVDIATAENAGMDCIAVGWGFRTRKEQEAAGGKMFIDRPVDIFEYL